MLTTVAWTLADGTVAYALEGAIFVDRRGRPVAARRARHHRRRAAEVGPLAAERRRHRRRRTSCRRSPASARRGGTRTPGARSSASPAARPRPTSPGRSSSRWRSRPATSSRPWCAASGTPLTELRVDGGASVMDALLQLQADQLGVTVRRPTDQETTALGAAYLAGLAEGACPISPASPGAGPSTRPSSRTAIGLRSTRPMPQWLRAVERSRGWAR